jgi:hypothetical protein
MEIRTCPNSPARWALGSAALGLVAWLAGPWLPAGSAPRFGSIEHTFAIWPLALAPLALVLRTRLFQEEGRAPVLWRIPAYAQPAAAAMALASLLAAKGPVAGGLAAGWLFWAFLVGVGGLRGVRLGTGENLSNVSLLAAHVFLPVGAAWFLLWRLGVGPPGFSALKVSLAALHFHFSGFTLQLSIAATGRLLDGRSSRLGALHRMLAVGAIAGIPLIAAGNLVPSSALKLLGVALMVVSTIALAVTTTAVALQSRSPLARALLFVSAASVGGGMVVAGIHGVRELAGGGIAIPRMVETHGILNAIGFALCNLVAHLQLRRRGRR